LYKQTTWTYTLNKFESWNVFKTSCHDNAKIYITVIGIEAIYYFGEESPEIFKESGTCKRPAVAQLVIGYKIMLCIEINYFILNIFTCIYAMILFFMQLKHFFMYMYMIFYKEKLQTNLFYK
jgi:hypothetical protein